MLTILQSTGANPMTSIMLFGGMFLIMYFFMIRPQMKKQKQEKTFQSEVSKGDKIVTTSGIHGSISEINDNFCTIETGAGKIKFERSAISKELTEKYSNK